MQKFSCRLRPLARRCHQQIRPLIADHELLKMLAGSSFRDGSYFFHGTTCPPCIRGSCRSLRNFLCKRFSVGLGTGVGPFLLGQRETLSPPSRDREGWTERCSSSISPTPLLLELLKSDHDPYRDSFRRDSHPVAHCYNAVAHSRHQGTATSTQVSSPSDHAGFNNSLYWSFSLFTRPTSKVSVVLKVAANAAVSSSKQEDA